MALVGVAEDAGKGVGGGGGGSADGDGLEGAAKPASAHQLAFERAEDSQSQKRDDYGEFEGFYGVAYEHVGKQGDDAAGDVGGGDGEGGAVGSVVGGLFEAELEAHHEIDPGGGVLFQRVEDWRCAGPVDGVVFEYLVDLFFFVVGATRNARRRRGRRDSRRGPWL